MSRKFNHILKHTLEQQRREPGYSSRLVSPFLSLTSIRTFLSTRNSGKHITSRVDSEIHLNSQVILTFDITQNHYIKHDYCLAQLYSIEMICI